MQAAVDSRSGGIPPPAGPLECIECEQSLSQQRYILHEGQPHCIPCYETKYANSCAECRLLIATDSKVWSRRRVRDDNGSAGHGSRVKWVNKSEWVTWVTGQYS